jgi:hypothetical protein
VQAQDYKNDIMNTQKYINNIITYMLFIGLGFSLVFVYFAQQRLYMQMTYGILSLGPEKYIRIASVILIFITVILSIFYSKKEYAAKVFVAYLVLFSYVLINFILTSPNIFELKYIMAIKGIGPWVCFGLIFVGYDDKRYAMFKNFLFISILFLSILVFFNLINFGAGEYRGIALSKYRVYAVTLVWMVPFVFLILKKNKKLFAFRIFAISIGIITALITQTRSFLLIYFFVLFFDYYNTKKKTYYAIGMIFMGIAFLYLLLNTESLGSSFELLVNRGTNDTRGGQLVQFFEQLNIFELIVGKGADAQYVLDGRMYYALDNQWLLLLWWAGFIPAAVYFYLTAIIPTRLFFMKNIDYETKVESFVLILWTLACAGLAIYTSMSVEFYFFIICIIQGRLLYKYSNINKYAQG